MNKVGMFSWFSYPMAIQKRFELIKEVGFDATSLWWAESDRNSQPDMARGIGLEIDNIHAPFHNMSNNLWLDGVDGGDYLNLLISCVNDCNMHDIETVVIHATGFRNVPAISQVGIDRIKKLVDFAEKKEVNLAFENWLTYLQILILRESDFVMIVVMNIVVIQMQIALNFMATNYLQFILMIILEKRTRIYCRMMVQLIGKTSSKILKIAEK